MPMKSDKSRGPEEAFKYLIIYSYKICKSPSFLFPGVWRNLTTSQLSTDDLTIATSQHNS